MQSYNYMSPNSTPLDPATGLPYVMPGSPYPGQPFSQPGGYQPPCQQGYAGPTCTHYGSQSLVEWVRTNPRVARVVSGRAVVAGCEGHDGTPLWVIRALYHGDLIPGKLAIDHASAYVAYGGGEHAVDDIEVCCIPAESYRWFPSGDGRVLPNAVVGGKTSGGEPLYIGRGRHVGSLTPGKIHPSQGVMYISFAGQEVALRDYDMLCTI